MLDETEWFRNSYFCRRCDIGWNDEWSCKCNDRCPECNAEIEPYASVELDPKTGLEPQ